MDKIDSGSISSNELNKGRLHVNPRGIGELTINFFMRIKKFATTLRVTGSFRMASSFDSHINFRSFNSMGNTEKPDSSAINQLNRTYSEEMLKMTR